MKINFECKKCGNIFDCDVGAVGIDNATFRPQFENDISCPKCGKCTIDEVMLTELGQGQLTKATFDFEPNGTIYSEDDIMVGLDSSGEGQGCDSIQRLNDLGLCESSTQQHKT